MKNILISGASNGLGKSLAIKFLSQGYQVFSLDLQPSNVVETNFVEFIGDISDPVFVSNSINAIIEKNNIDIVINNAGEPVFKVPEEYTSEDITKCFKGLEGMILITSNLLKTQKEIKIVNILSSAAIRGKAKESVYCAAKWGERGYTESLKDAYKGTNIKVIGVYPGGINTEFYKQSRDYVSVETQSKFMNPDEVADIIINNIDNDLNLTVADIIIERS